MDEYISRKDAIKELHDVYEYEYPTASGDLTNMQVTMYRIY